MSAYASAVNAINDADLSPCEYRAARRLLDLAHPETGTVRLDEATALWACCVGSWGAVRRLLGALQGIDLIRYRAGRDAGDGADITFSAWPASVIHSGSPVRENGSPVIRFRAPVECPACHAVIGNGSPVIENGSQAAESDETVIQFGSPARENGSPVIGNGSPPHTRETDMSVRSSVSDPPIEEPINELPNSAPEARRRPPPDLAEYQRNYALLTDPAVGLDEFAARRLAGGYPFDVLLRHVFTWRRQLDSGTVRGTGALITRVERGFSATVADGDRQSDLYRRHCPEEAGNEYDRYLPDEYRGIILG